MDLTLQCYALRHVFQRLPCANCTALPTAQSSLHSQWGQPQAGSCLLPYTFREQLFRQQQQICDKYAFFRSAPAPSVCSQTVTFSVDRSYQPCMLSCAPTKQPDTKVCFPP